jgi:hypothetical protein
LRCSWPAMARIGKLARPFGYWVNKVALAARQIGSRILRPPGSSPVVAAEGARGQHHCLGVEDGISPPKPNHRRGVFLFAAIRCLATAIIASGAAADIFQGRQALREGAGPILDQIDGGAGCLGPKRGFGMGLGEGWQAGPR